jgi:murein DD-endopeptidase MepM/ murein hydrolase activator NlpD
MRTLSGAVTLAASIAGATASAQGQPVRFRYPLEGCSVGCASVTAYFDRDPEPDASLRDWNCSTRTYDGHLGTDFAPFGGFAAQDQGVVVVAAAPGVVSAVHDGEPDRCTSGACGGGLGNHVVIAHRDGVSSVYGHLRRGSIRVATGRVVRCAEPIALLGSSGNSSGPHLHFEARRGDTAIDTFEGRAACGGGESLWVSQGPYRALPSEACIGDEPEDMDASIFDGSTSSDASVSSDASADAPGSEGPEGGVDRPGRVGCACEAIPTARLGRVMRAGPSGISVLALLVTLAVRRASASRGPRARV